MTLSDNPHRRYNALTGEWVLVSPHRSQRPWQGQQEQVPLETRLAHDPACYLCPGNQRAGEAQNPEYESTFVFTNDFSALMPDVPQQQYRQGELLQAESERGICKVICFSPRHDLTLAQMEVADIARVVEVWQQQYLELGSLDYINYVQIFENKGEMMGCSNPHPHGQIWAQQTVPVEPMKEQLQQEKYFSTHGRSLLHDYLKLELQLQERLVAENEHFVALVPFWAVWPFETMIISRSHVQHLGQLSELERFSLADIIHTLTYKYDQLFGISFPYSSGIHQSPTDGKEHPAWHLHMHFYPPLLRSATIRKFMVGYELLGNPQRDLTPEWSAQRLRELPVIV